VNALLFDTPGPVEHAIAQVPQWYAVQTRSRHEKCVAEQLRSKSMEAFLPIQRCRHKWKNGVVADVELPLFPCYLFARAAAQERINLLRIPGVIGLAASTARPSAIPNEEIELLRQVTGSFRAEPHPFLNAGDTVRIVAGPLAGLEGILSRRKQQFRLVLSVQVIMRSIAIEVSELDIEPILAGRNKA
jgi:transcription antitermination factor NusG